MFHKTTIINRKKQNIVVTLEDISRPHGLVFVMHGLGGFKEQLHIEMIAQTFLVNGYTVVRFDATNSLGESDGQYEDATTTNYYEDLEDVIAWSQDQPWYQEPFVLAGHSCGALCVALYAERYPQKVKALAPVSVVVSGRLNYENTPKDELEAWESTGWKEKISKSKPGVKMRLKWSHMIDRLHYDLLPDAGRLSMPVLLVVGSEDKTTPLEHHQMLYEKLPGQRELKVIEGAKHTFHEDAELRQLRDIFKEWIRQIK